MAERQPGSAIKPLTYAAALDPQWSNQGDYQPFTPATIIADLPTTFYVKDEKGGNVPYVPANYDRAFHGPVSVRTALANSYNIPAVKTLDHIGVETLKALATQAGISTFTGDLGLALTLGGSEVQLLELTAAYGIFAHGARLEPRAILRIEQADAQQPALAQPRQAPRTKVITPETAYLITDILADNVARIGAFGENSVVELPFPAAVKTGTTTDWRDNWTIGYSTARIVGVWVGNADNTPMLDVSGIDGAGPIWRDLMLAAHGEAPAPFPRPANIAEVVICAPSGLLPSAACPRTRRERFIAGSAPTQVDDQFQPIMVDLATGLRATADTPANRQAERVYWLLPAAYHDWMIGQGIALAPADECGARGAGCGITVRAQAGTIAAKVARPAQALVLAAPTSNTAYQLHPGLPVANQRIRIGGYVSAGDSWAQLRLMKDDLVLAEASDARRLERWWVLEPGAHRFWLEGKAADDSEWTRSESAFVLVENFAAQNVATSD